MLNKTRSIGLLCSCAVALLSVSGCNTDPITPPATGKLELALAAPTTSGTPQSVGTRLTIRSTGWQVDELLFGRCAGACNETEIDAWLTSRADALYGLIFTCPVGEPCVGDPHVFGFEQATYGSCPTNVHSMLHPTEIDPALGLVDDMGLATDCTAVPPVVDDGATYYVYGYGTDCKDGSSDECTEIHAVRFFQIQNGQLVDVGGTTDDRRPVHFADSNP